jgi:hypothetical protein
LYAQILSANADESVIVHNKASQTLGGGDSLAWRTIR